MESEHEQLPIFIDDADQPQPLSKILFIAGGAIVLIFIICIFLTSLSKSPSAAKIDMPKSALTKPEGEVAGTATQQKEVYGAEEPPKTTPTPSTSSGPTATPTSSTGSGSTTSSPTATPIPNPTSKPADPTNTPTPTDTPTQTPTISPTDSPTQTPTPTQNL